MFQGNVGNISKPGRKNGQYATHACMPSNTQMHMHIHASKVVVSPSSHNVIISPHSGYPPAPPTHTHAVSGSLPSITHSPRLLPAMPSGTTIAMDTHPYPPQRRLQNRDSFRLVATDPHVCMWRGVAAEEDAVPAEADSARG